MQPEFYSKLTLLGIIQLQDEIQYVIELTAIVSLIYWNSHKIFRKVGFQAVLG